MIKSELVVPIYTRKTAHCRTCGEELRPMNSPDAPAPAGHPHECPNGHRWLLDLYYPRIEHTFVEVGKGATANTPAPTPGPTAAAGE